MNKKFFVIADLHFGHKNVIPYCNRPYSDIENMNSDLVKRWNETVTNKDTVFVLGDVAFGKDNISKYVPLLNGHKVLIKGNHDTYSDEYYRECGFKEVSKYPVLFDFFLLSHEPLILSETTPYFNFYGHVHNDSKFVDNATSKCVSVERIGYKPFCFLER